MNALPFPVKSYLLEILTRASTGSFLFVKIINLGEGIFKFNSSYVLWKRPCFQRKSGIEKNPVLRIPSTIA